MKTSKKISLSIMIIMLLFSGINHLINPNDYILIMPSYLPAQYYLVIISGLAELILGVLFCIPTYRYLAVYGTIAMLFSFLPVHFYHLQLGTFPIKDLVVPFWAVAIRIPIQFLMMFWAWGLRK